VLLGYRPELFACPRCGKRLPVGRLAYAPDLGGVVCASCITGASSEIPLSVGAVKALRLLLVDAWQELTSQRLSAHLRGQIEAVLHAALRTHLDGPFESAEVAALLERREGNGSDGASAASVAGAGG
jgi:DNA repair protein RecO (recombination protein O)